MEVLDDFKKLYYEKVSSKIIPGIYFNIVVDGFDSTVTMNLLAWALAVFQNEQVFVSHTLSVSI